MLFKSIYSPIYLFIHSFSIYLFLKFISLFIFTTQKPTNDIENDLKKYCNILHDNKMFFLTNKNDSHFSCDSKVCIYF